LQRVLKDRWIQAYLSNRSIHQQLLFPVGSFISCWVIYFLMGHLFPDGSLAAMQYTDQMKILKFLLINFQLITFDLSTVQQRLITSKNP